MKRIIAATFISLILIETVLAHSGRTRESDGCHVDTKAGIEHCH